MSLSVHPKTDLGRLNELALPVAAQLHMVEEQLEAILGDDAGGVAPQLYRHVLKAGGKRLRPLLALLSCAAAGGDPNEAIFVATSVEVIHLSSLIHDDVIDEAEERRGQPSARKRFGNRASILVGDLLIAEVYRRLSSSFGRAALTVISEAVVQMCHAELRHDDLHERADARSYFESIRGKTAALLAASCEIGAMMSSNHNAPPHLRDYGLAIGFAFQITDDLLDLYGDPEVLGKPVRQDLQRGSWTLPVICALNEAAPEERQSLETVLKAVARGEHELGPEAAALVEQAGGRAAAERRAAEYVAQAREALSGLPESPSLASLHGLAEYILRRHG